MLTSLRVCHLVLFAASAAPTANWPGWRGPGGQGHARGKDLPVTWGPATNVRWKTPLPEGGNSSPVVWGDRVFLTQALDPKGHRRAVLCFRRADGKLLWQKETAYPGDEPTHATNPYCSATPVTDGDRVIASLGSAGLVCYGFDGKLLWHRELGKMYHIWGNASSPILYGDLAILWYGPGDGQKLLAVDKRSGKPVWEHIEPGGMGGKAADAGSWVGSWATPIVVKVAGHDELILSVPHKVKGFDPKTGTELWHCDGLGPLVYASPVCSEDGIVVALSGFYGPALAVRAGGHGDVTRSHRLWIQARKNPQRIGSPVIVGRHAYLLNEPGIAQCFELETGKELWDGKRLDRSWSSFVAAGDRLYGLSMSGEGFVVAASPRFRLLGRSALPERTLASPAVADGELFIRTYRHLWCIHKAAAKP
jgi:outer membrane protein assembly factor BamB